MHACKKRFVLEQKYVKRQHRDGLPCDGLVLERGFIKTPEIVTEPITEKFKYELSHN